ncbi:MAG TPA: NHL repeat-containing protein [Myxococcales bacterium]|nr:NHL repeat-containing protein [Myxococcales bacterium]
MIAQLALVLAAALPLDPASSGYADEKGVMLRSPEGVACTDSGTVVAADTGNGRLVLFTFQDGKLVAGRDVRAPELGRPIRLQLDSKGNVLALDGKGRRIARIGAGGAFAGFLQLAGIPQANGFFPISFKIGPADAVYLLDASSARVVVVDAAGAFQRQLELPRGGSFTDIAVDAQGTVYAVDGVAAQLFLARPGASTFAPLGRPLKDVLNFPTYLTLTAQGPIVLVDQHGNGLVILGKDGAYLGRRLSIGWSEGLVYYPGQVCINSRGDAFVADRGNHRIQAFTAPK